MNTESINPRTKDLDQKDSLGLVQTFIQEDKQVLVAIDEAQQAIAKAIDMVYAALAAGGRLFYFGAGTSGRLGILDASECPPTFSTDPEMVQGVIAGGERAIQYAVENAEDDVDAGAEYVKEQLNAGDIAVGIAASGSTPYVCGALGQARQQGLKTIAIANNSEAQLFEIADHYIYLATGPEVLAGSTRLKAGTSQKMVLNIITTSVMVKLGKVHGNLMVDVKVSNEKLYRRAVNLVKHIAKVDEEEAKKLLELNNMSVKAAIQSV